MFSSTNVKFFGNHPKFIKAMETASNYAVTKTPVLITGESGVGKKSLARFIHEKSARSAAPVLFVDCSLSASEVESQILGYRDEEGNFHRGIIEKANGGTIVFCHIENLDDSFQKRLFQVIQELGDYEIDLRLIATTTKNLSKYVGAGRFQRSLFTLFSNSQIHLIPLRERGTDLQVIANELITSWCHQNGEEPIAIADAAMDKLQSLYWSKNITELMSVISNSLPNVEGSLLDLNAIETGERKMEIVTADGDEEGFKLMSLKDAEKLLIRKALVHTSENRTQAAKILGVSIRTLRNKINEYRTEGSNFFVNLK